jgi:hypothetical protein
VIVEMRCLKEEWAVHCEDIAEVDVRFEHHVVAEETLIGDDKGCFVGDESWWGGFKSRVCRSKGVKSEIVVEDLERLILVGGRRRWKDEAVVDSVLIESTMLDERFERLVQLVSDVLISAVAEILEIGIGNEMLLKFRTGACLGLDEDSNGERRVLVVGVGFKIVLL